MKEIVTVFDSESVTLATDPAESQLTVQLPIERTLNEKGSILRWRCSGNATITGSTTLKMFVKLGGQIVASFDMAVTGEGHFSAQGDVVCKKIQGEESENYAVLRSGFGFLMCGIVPCANLSCGSDVHLSLHSDPLLTVTANSADDAAIDVVISGFDAVVVEAKAIDRQ